MKAVFCVGERKDLEVKKCEDPTRYREMGVWVFIFSFPLRRTSGQNGGTEDQEEEREDPEGGAGTEGEGEENEVNSVSFLFQ